MSVSVSAFINGAKAIQKANPTYKLGHSGNDGYCDCIGLIIGALTRAGGKWNGIHGSNYAARYALKETIKTINSQSVLSIGDIVFKGRTDTSKLPEKYMQGGSSYNGDLLDYYHVGMVISTSPFIIMHCTTPGNVTRDTKLGKWGYYGKLKQIDYTSSTQEEISVSVMIATVTGGALNLREKPSTSATKLTSIPNGETVSVSSTDGDWSAVIYNGYTGYVMTKFLSIGTSNTINLTLNKTTAQALYEALGKALSE